MANNIVLVGSIRKLPYELRLHIYSFVYCIDYDSLEDLHITLQYTLYHSLPPRSVLLKEPGYIKYREQYHPDVDSSGGQSWLGDCWPDHLEDAFLTAIERVPVSYSNPRRRNNEFLAETISALTGTEINRKQCARHLQFLKGCIPSAVLRSEPTALPLIEDILNLKGPNELWATFHHLHFHNGLSILEKIYPFVSPALLHATANIHFSIDINSRRCLPWYMLSRTTFPCLENLYIDLNLDIETLQDRRDQHGKSLWTTLEEDMQAVVRNINRGVLWLCLANCEGRGPDWEKRFEVSPKMRWREGTVCPSVLESLDTWRRGLYALLRTVGDEGGGWRKVR